MTERALRQLQAYHDGELSIWGRFWVERRLRADDSAREQLEQLREIGSLLRESAAEAPEPDLWDAIRAELPYQLRETSEATLHGATASGSSRWRWGAPLAAAAAAAAVALTLLLDPGDAGGGPSIRWLDSGTRPAMVLQDDREATIIWVLDGPAGVSMRHGDALLRGAHYQGDSDAFI